MVACWVLKILGPTELFCIIRLVFAFELETEPTRLYVTSLLGVCLDQLKKFPTSETCVVDSILESDA